MLTLTPAQFVVKIESNIAELNKTLNRQLPIIIGKTAVDYFKATFDSQAWDRSKWKEVKRRTPGTKEYKYNSVKHPTRLVRGILIGDNGALRRSIQYETKPGAVDITSDLPYARVHNKGEMAGRSGHQFKMPKRQFIGMSKELDDTIKKEISNALKNILKP